MPRPACVRPVAGTSAPASSLAVAALASTMLLSSLGTSIANVALPTFAGTFGASFQAVQWIVLAYLLAMTTVVVSVGRLGDLVGRRRLMLAGISMFTLASMACGASSGLWMLVAARVVQGFGAAVMMALAAALVADAVPQARAGRAMGLLGALSAAGTALGPSLGGLLIEFLGWRSIFLVNVPIAVAALVLAHRHLPRDAPRDTRPSFDLIGSALMAVALVTYALAMTLERGATSRLAVLLLAVAIAGAWLFVVVERRVRVPLLRPQLFRHRMLGAGFAMGALVATVAMTTLVVGPFHLSGGLGLSPAAIGMVMTAGPLVAALAGLPAGHGVDRFGARRMTVAGLVAMTCGAFALAVVPMSTGIAGYVLPLVVTTAGFAIFQAANNTALMASVEPDQRGVVSGLLNLSRNLGLITGASAMGAVFAAAAGTTDIDGAAPAAIAAGTRAAFGTATLLAIAALVLAIAVAKPSRR